MASESPPGRENRLSFANIAAMDAPSHIRPISASEDNENLRPSDVSPCPHPHESSAAVPAPHSVDDVGKAVEGIDDLSLKPGLEGRELLLDGHGHSVLKRENSFEDDRTHLSNSSTKMTNFDSKSLASVTTFAMDEKDSVRPDDSASVQAIDEEESFSGPASGAPNSVTGSEAGGRAFRDFRDGSLLRPRGVLQVPGPLFNDTNQPLTGTIPPDSVSNNFVIPPEGLQDSQNLHGFPLEADEKLLEAMKSPKDRLLILQLEEKIRYFVRESDEQSLELPPSNAFGRLLAHKLGDYYHLTHFVDNNVTSVRLHRTPFCRLPAPLSAVHASGSTTPPPSLPAMKIMRRTDGERPSTEGSVATSSSIPSKATSEAGDSGQDGDRTGSSTDATPAKDRLTLTREEREAKYQEVRERIFRDFPDSAKSDTASGDSNPNMSRSSSTTGRKKAQRQRTPYDDSFEARSQFNAYYPGAPYNNGPAPYNPGVNEGSYPNQVPYLVGPGVAPPAGGNYIPPSQNNNMYPGQMNMNNMPQYPVAMSPQVASNGPWQGGNMPQQSPYSGYASVNQSPGMMSQQSSSKSSPAMTNYAVPNPSQYPQGPNWSTSPYPGNYQQSLNQRNQPPIHWPNYPPSQPVPSNVGAYPYAQYPGQHLNPSLQNQSGPHAIPAGFARSQSHFNPQTRSFVPGGVPGGAPLGRHPNKGAQHTMQPYGSMHPGLQAQWTGYPDTAAQGRNLDHTLSNRGPASAPRNSIAKWGTPSHLPPKPPPSQVASDFDLKRAGPASVPGSSYPGNGIPPANNGPLVVSGGASMSKSN